MALFKARDSNRDKTGDKARLDALMRHIGDVRMGVMKERRGLERRYSDFIGQASHLVDTGYDGERDEGDEADLTRAEDNAVYARRRMAELDYQLESLDGLVERVKVMFEPPEELRKRRRRSPQTTSTGS